MILTGSLAHFGWWCGLMNITSCHSEPAFFAGEESDGGRAKADSSRDKTALRNDKSLWKRSSKNLGVRIRGKNEQGSAPLLRRQKLNLHIAARGLEVIIRRHKNAASRLRRKLHSESVHVRNLSFQFDQRRANRPIRICWHRLRTARGLLSRQQPDSAGFAAVTKPTSLTKSGHFAY